MLLPVAGHSQGKVCIGTKSLYEATGMVGSVFEYAVPPTGGKLLSDRPDSVVVQWGDTRGVFALGVREISKHGCLGDWAYLDVEVIGASIKFEHEVFQLCGDSIQMNFNHEDFMPAFTWSDSTIRDNWVHRPGNYELKAFDLNGCLISKTVTVLSRPRVDLGHDTIICRPGYRLLANRFATDGTAGLHPPHIDFEWSNGSGEAFVYVDPDDTDRPYWVTAKAGTCVVSDTIMILACRLPEKEEEKQVIINIPNTFTPNGDGDNDTWRIDELKEYPNATVEVYDRWNRRVHKSSHGYNSEWNGRDTDGKQLPIETYYYVIHLNDGVHIKPLTGTITIVK